jgi:hypothetical protein
VSEWRDKSGNARHASQGTSANRATVSTAAQNGRDALSFDGTNDFFSLASALPLANSGSFELFYAGRPNNTGRNNSYAGGGIARQYPGSDAAGSWAAGIRSSGSIAVIHHLADGSNANGMLFGGTVTSEANTIASWSYNTASGSTSADRWAMRINAGSPVSETTAATASGWGVGNGEIGRSWIGTEYHYQGLMFEVIITSAELTTADRERVEGYLAHRWGLTADLPSGHPYKTSPP